MVANNIHGCKRICINKYAYIHFLLISMMKVKNVYPMIKMYCKNKKKYYNNIKVKESQSLLRRETLMIRISDIIEEFIKEMIAENEKDVTEIQRNELANHFSCAPSQINYVLTTRFTTEKGYYIESRRGGGGCIKISKVEYVENQPLADVILDKIGESITYDGGAKIIDALRESEVISCREMNILKSVINDRTLGLVNDYRNKIRAEILKSSIMAIML